MSEIFGSAIDIIVIILLAAVIILAVFLILANRKVKELDRRLYDLSAGSEGESLEDMLIRILDNYDGINKQLEQNTGDIRDIYRRLHGVVQKIGLVKYDAFSQMGGNLSSVIALLDQDNNGVLLNTVQNVDGCYSYVKGVRGGRSDVAFTEEEQQAMDIALEKGSMAGRKKNR